VKKLYDNLGYVQYTAEIDPHFHVKAGDPEGTVDLTVMIDEGQAFKIRSIKFVGNGNVGEDDLMRQMLVRRGEVFNKGLFDDSITALNQLGLFEAIDADKDVDYRSDKTTPDLDLVIHLKR